jgi:hypothetical protein
MCVTALLGLRIHTTGYCSIMTPNAVKNIGDTAFKNCPSLTNVEFCDKIEDCVCCEAMRGWWNQGANEKSPITYCSLVKFNIRDRLGLVLVLSWQASIYDMLRRIPTISTEGLGAYFDTIHCQLTVYEDLSEAPMLLELAVPNDDIVWRILSYF